MAKGATVTGSTFLFTGTLTEFTRAEAESLVKDNGGAVISGVTSKLNYLVVGADAGSKLDKAKALGTVKILTEKEFLKMVQKGNSTAKKPLVMKVVAKKVVAKKVAAKQPAAKKVTAKKPAAKKPAAKKPAVKLEVGKKLTDAQEPQFPDYRNMRFGSSEAQVKLSFDVSDVDYTDLEADATKLGVEMSVFEDGALLSDSPSEYSSVDLFAVLNPEVIFLLTNHPFMGSLRVMFSEDPSSSIYPGPDYGRIHKNMHLCIDKDSTGLSISLKREHYYECDDEIYDYGDVSADEIRAIMEETEKRDDADKEWDVFDVDGRIDEEDIDSFRARFYAFYTRDEMYI